MVRISFFFGCLLLAQAAVGEDFPLAAWQCQGCHGPRGVSQGPAIPTIAGMSEDEMQAAFAQFQRGERGSTMMHRLATGYDGAEIVRIAAYFAAQSFAFQPQPHDPARAQKGAKIHRKFCNKCHTKQGTSNKFDAPVLAGQWLPYLRHAMTDFTTQQRPMPKKMRTAMNRLRARFGDEGLEDVLHFYASRQP